MKFISFHEKILFQVDTPDADEDDEDSSEEDEDETEDNKTLQQSAVDITEKFIRERLEQKEIVTAIVLRSLPQIPPEIPANFCNSYTPIGKYNTKTFYYMLGFSKLHLLVFRIFRTSF